MKSCVRVNCFKTDMFDIKCGSRQGDGLSPTLFSLYINDLAEEINKSQLGVRISPQKVISILLYADDIVLISENEQNLQKMLNIVNNWITRWRMKVNLPDKTKIVQFRNIRANQSKYNFHIGNRPVQYADSYPYLGLVLNFHLNFADSVETLTKSASRALAS